MRLGTCNVRSLYKADSLIAAPKELSNYRTDLVGVQEVRWEGRATEREGEYIFLQIKMKENHELLTGFSDHKRIISAVKRIEFVIDRMSCIILRVARAISLF
jgi:hypothetical protein